MDNIDILGVHASEDYISLYIGGDRVMGDIRRTSFRH